jgi:hypothetical protein
MIIRELLPDIDYDSWTSEIIIIILYYIIFYYYFFKKFSLFSNIFDQILDLVFCNVFL